MKINKSQFFLKALVNLYHYFSMSLCLKDDYLTIYDGESTNAPVLVPGSNGTSLAGQTYLN